MKQLADFVPGEELFLLVLQIAVFSHGHGASEGRKQEDFTFSS